MRSVFTLLALALSVASQVTATTQASPKDHMALLQKRSNHGPNDVEVLNYALTLEYLEAAFYAEAVKKFSAADFKKAGYSDRIYHRVQEAAGHEAAHVTFLAKALGSAGVHKCKYDFSAALTSVEAFLATMRIVEGVGASAYLGAASDLTNKAYLAAAGSILTIEARHSAYLNEVFGQTGFPTAFEQSLNYAQVYSLAGGFIKPGTCGKAGALPSSLKSFPALTYTKPAKGKKDASIKFTPLKKYKGPYYVAYLNGGATHYEIVENHKNQNEVPVPKGLTGLTYVIVTTSPRDLTNANTVAGPAAVFFE